MKKNQRPIEYDISFRYICDKCGVSHWLFFREVNTPEFKIVCDCKQILYPETISNIDIIYQNNKNLNENAHKEIIENSIKAIMSFGYSRQDATDMTQESVSKNTFDNTSDLVKYSLKHFGANYV